MAQAERDAKLARLAQTGDEIWAVLTTVQDRHRRYVGRMAGPGHVEDVPVSASEPNRPKAGR